MNLHQHGVKAHFDGKAEGDTSPGLPQGLSAML